MSKSEAAVVPTLKVIVGRERTEFLVNKALVSSASKLFNTICTNKPRTHSGATVYRETTRVVLPSCKPKNFTIFLYWARTRNLLNAPGIIDHPPITSMDSLVATKSHQEIISAKYDQFCDLLIDSCTIESEGFEEEINEAMIKLCKDIFVAFGIFDGTPVRKITNICKATNNTPLRILEPQLSIPRAEKWMHDHDGYMMLHNAQRQFCDELMVTSMMIRLGKSKPKGTEDSIKKAPSDGTMEAAPQT